MKEIIMTKKTGMDWDRIEDLCFKILLTSAVIAIPIGTAILMYFVTDL